MNRALRLVRRRLITAIPVIGLVTIGAFLLLEAAPGDAELPLSSLEAEGEQAPEAETAPVGEPVGDGVQDVSDDAPIAMEDAVTAESVAEDLPMAEAEPALEIAAAPMAEADVIPEPAEMSAEADPVAAEPLVMADEVPEEAPRSAPVLVATPLAELAEPEAPQAADALQGENEPSKPKKRGWWSAGV